MGEASEKLYRRGNEYYERGDFEKAIEFYSQALKLRRTNYKIYYNRGLAFACLEEYNKAIEDFRKVIGLNENLAEVYYVEGLCFEFQDMMKSAVIDYKKALQLDPDFHDAKKHLDSYESKMSAKSDSDPTEIIERANLFEEHGLHVQASEILEEGLRDDPDNIKLLLRKRVKNEKSRHLSKVETVCGLDKLKEKFDLLITFPLKNSRHPLYSAPIAQTCKGILIYGPPGCGKTLSVNSLAKKVGLTLLEVVLSEVLNLYLGESEKRLTAVFNEARTIAKGGTPVLLFIDEVDALGHMRDQTPTDSVDTACLHNLISTFLRLFNEIQDIPNIIVVGATNRPWSVDEALKRPGRLGSAVIYCPPPDEGTREELFRLFTRDTPGHEDLDFKKLASLTEWFSGDDIRGVCRDVHFKVAREKLRKTARLEEKREGAYFQQYLEFIDEKTPQCRNWICQVQRAIIEGKIEEFELDKDLRGDISRFCAYRSKASQPKIGPELLHIS